MQLTQSAGRGSQGSGPARARQSVGQTRTLDQLCDLMVTVSSNFATNLLIQKLGIESIRATVASLHADSAYAAWAGAAASRAANAKQMVFMKILRAGLA